MSGAIMVSSIKDRDVRTLSKISSNIFGEKYIKYTILNRDKPGLTKILTGTTDKNTTVGSRTDKGLVLSLVPLSTDKRNNVKQWARVFNKRP